MWSKYGIGRIPMPVAKVETASRQERRHAAVAEYVRPRAAQARAQLPAPGQASAPVVKPKSPDSYVEKPPRELNELRFSLLRKLMAVFDDWKICPNPACRRHRGCVSQNLECANLPPERERSPEREQAALADLQRALARRRTELTGKQEK